MVMFVPKLKDIDYYPINIYRNNPIQSNNLTKEKRSHRELSRKYCSVAEIRKTTQSQYI